MSYRELKRRVKEMLLKGDTKGLSALVEKHARTISVLISLSYDKESVLTWRAIEAIGPLVKEVTDKSSGAGRIIVQRLLWSITEESGGIGWSAVEMLGEVVRSCPDGYNDLTPIIMGLFDEEIFRTGVLHAICRISEKKPIPLNAAAGLLNKALIDKDPEVRGSALLTLQCLQRTTQVEVPEAVKELIHDNSKIKVYCDGELTERTIMELAEPLIEAS
ncbi:MAG TPA: hypothetical protein ENI58_00745 [Nitrospirae bacterium]|nr:hypothetical protein [Nitrospirota bacterium]